MASLSLVLGRVSDRSAVLNLVAREPQEVTIGWGAASRGIENESKAIRLLAGQPAEFPLDELRPGTEYVYRVRGRGSDGAIRDLRTGCRVQTQRTVGQSFSFTVQGDSHPERPQMFDAGLYARTLQAVAADRPDFHVCMGDDFSLARLPTLNAETIASRYALQRPFLGLVGQSAPIFLLNGNHEQASLYNYLQPGEQRDAAVWAQRARNRYFSLPEPDGFFTGNPKPRDGIGPMRDYYAWTWGDALFVVLDNYWHSPACVDTKLNEDDARKQGRDRNWWDITLGDEQYAWFAKTLESSNAKFKFVFAHHVMGTGRGGVERAGLYEWGGRSERGGGGGGGGGGGDEFKRRRPDWELPVHQLMVRHGVSIFFQGHDHLYARQQLDGIVYQTVPVPADPNYAIYNDERYTTGVKRPNSGHLRVSVNPRESKVEYVRSYLEADANGRQGEIAHSYTLQPKA